MSKPFAFVNRLTSTTTIGLALFAFTCIWAVSRGLDANWDLLNYHYWSVYALFNGLTFSDVGPGQIQSWFNPVVNVPAYLAITFLHPLLATIALSALAAINGLLLLLLAKATLSTGGRKPEPWALMLIVAAGLSGPMFLTQIGTTSTDNICSIFVLAGLLALYSGGAYRFFLCGVAFGIAAGLKFTAAPYAVAIALTLLVCWRSWSLTIPRYIGFALGGILGAAVIAGFWAWYLYAETGNPMFPYFNGFFESPYFEPRNLQSRHYLPESLAEALTYPFRWAVGDHTSSQFPFRDIRFAVLTLALPAVLLVSLVRRRSATFKPIVAARDFQLLATFFVLAFVIWLALFGIARYITALEILAGLVIFMCVDRIVLRPVPKMWTAIVVIALCIVTMSPAVRAHVDGFPNSFFGIKKKDLKPLEPGTLFVMTVAGRPISYVLPYLPQPASAVRLTGNFAIFEFALPQSPWGEMALAAIADHTGPKRSLSVEPCERSGCWWPSPLSSTLNGAQLRAYGLELAPDPNCIPIRTRYHTLSSCELRELEPEPQ